MNEVFGIDVSHHNGCIDWEQVARSGKKFAIMKCQYEAQSHRVDEYFERNYEEAGGCLQSQSAHEGLTVFPHPLFHYPTVPFFLQMLPSDQPALSAGRQGGPG